MLGLQSQCQSVVSIKIALVQTQQTGSTWSVDTVCDCELKSLSAGAGVTEIDGHLRESNYDQLEPAELSDFP